MSLLDDAEQKCNASKIKSHVFPLLIHLVDGWINWIHLTQIRNRHICFLSQHFSPLNKHDRCDMSATEPVIRSLARARGGCPSPGCCSTWTEERMRGADWSQTRRAPSRIALLSACRYCRCEPQAREQRRAQGVHLRSGSEWVSTDTMDATIYQIIFGELGDLNCSLIDAFQDTFLENASLSLLSSDGKMELLSSLLFITKRCFIATWKRKPTSVHLPFFHFIYFQGLYCNATTDEIGTCWPRSITGRIVERPCPEYINGVKYNTTSKMFSFNEKSSLTTGLSIVRERHT